MSQKNNNLESTSKELPKVSIVVPIYKVEKYLRKCVDSILSQTMKDIEVILVDDGSPDKCGKIIDDYAKKDKRVIAFHQKNSGYSAAVNRGIDLARGEYIGIVESDDYIEPDMYEKLYADAKKWRTDVTKGMFYIYDSTKTSQTKKSSIKSFNNDSLGNSTNHVNSAANKLYLSPMNTDLLHAPSKAFAPSAWPEILAGHASIWSAIYRADFIKNHKIPASAGASYQDLPFITDVYTSAKIISVVKTPFYHWRNEPHQSHSTSASGKKSLKMAENTLLALDILKKSGKYDIFKEAFFAQAIWTNSRFFFRLNKKYQNEYFKLLKQIFLDTKETPADIFAHKKSQIQTKKSSSASFSAKFFRPEDKLSLQIINNTNSPRLLKLTYIFGGIRRRITK